MRLIDARKLTKAIQEELWDWATVDGILATTVLKQTLTDISNEPTVNAIPVDWIIRWAAEHMEYGTLSVERMLEDWSKESSRNMAKTTN